MYNFYAKFAKILEICKFFSENLVTEEGNIRRPGPVPKFSDLEVIALSLTAESESIDSEKWLFDCKLQEYKDCFPNLISRREYNDRRKKTARLCEEIRKRIVMKMDGAKNNSLWTQNQYRYVELREVNAVRWGKQEIISLLPILDFVLHKTPTTMAINCTQYAG